MMINTLNPNWQQENIQHLYTDLARIRELLTRYIQRASSGENADVPVIESVTSATLNQLCYLFNISPFERDILLLCLGMEIDPSFEKLCVEVQGDPQRNYPTLSLAFAVFPQVDFGVFSSYSALLRWQLIEIGESASFIQSPLRIDRRILCYLLGQLETDSQLSSRLSFLSPASYSLPPSHQQIVEEIIKTWQQRANFTIYPVVQICGNDITSKQAIAVTACQQAGFGIRRMSAELLPINSDECFRLMQRWQREAILTNSVLFLECDQISVSDLIRWPTLTGFIENANSLIVISTQERFPQRQRSIINYDLPSLSYGEQFNIWQNYLGESASKLNGHLSTIVSQFNLSPATIQTACLQLQNSEPENLASQIWRFCRTQARPSLDDLAQRIESNATWKDLIIPEREKQVLKNIATHLNYKSTVYQDWGFAKKGGRGLGISALFYGQSGTGKTLAAEVLAREFGLDLYRIDLSATVSKYIGETEKNLRRIFDAAETGGAVLLFDEADAIFGKRTEVKDSHDRHANVEVAYLLQRMEAYQGLAILTTNLKDSLDQAFTRRIRFIVQFPFPDVKARREIWQRAFPGETPIDDLDFDKLAKLNVSGGNIRSIALNAAFLAAENGGILSMSHLVLACQREYIKMGRSLTEAEFKDWA